MADQKDTPVAPASNVQSSSALIVDPSLSHYYLNTPAEYKQQLRPNIKCLVVGAVIIVRCSSSSSSASSTNDSQAPAPRVLLIQRALTDTAPGIWEVPGGTCDDTDPSLIAAVARELREETGLAARAALGLADIERAWQGRLAKVTFLVDVEGPRSTTEEPSSPQPLSSWNGLVKLDPKEHSAFVWATEEEVRQDLVEGGQRLVWRRNAREKTTVLEGFRMVAAAALRESQATGQKGEEASRSEKEVDDAE